MTLERKVFELTNLICEKSASEDNIEELNTILKDSSSARQTYLAIMDMHFDLDRMSLTGALSLSNDRCESLIKKLDPLEENTRSKTSTSLYWSIAALLAVSLSLLFTLGINSQSKYEAVVIESLDKEWTVGSTFKIQDELKLKKDEKIKLQFADNTIIELTGPISTSLEKSDQNGKKFSVNQPNTESKKEKLHIASNSTIIELGPPQKSSRAKFKVIESGNAFGIQFKESLTEVHVFKGRVTSHSMSAEKLHSERQNIHHLQAAGFNKEGLLKKWTEPDYKSFEVKRTVTGVKSTNKYVHWLSSKPKSLKHGQMESNESIFLIQEKKNIILPHDLPVTFSDRISKAQKGTQSAYDTHIRMLQKGTKVDSYILHYDSATKKFLDGDIHFERPIIAIIARTDQLDNSDKLFAIDGLEYPSSKSSFRGLDGNRKDEDVDVLKYKGNPYSIGIRFNLETDTVDQIRILIQSEDP